jgi:FKBP-type peptidyl-prolyl cis-trans isomerase FkpA
LLNFVKPPFLYDKTITLPIEIKMSRILLACGLFFVVCMLAACTKSSLYGSVQYKAQAKIDDQILTQYIADAHITGARHVNDNDTIGVYYVVLDPGQGNTLYTNSTMVTVGDTGRLITKGLTTDGKIFQQTTDFHPSFSIGDMILGWQLGIPMVKSGGEVRLLVPSRYAYGHFAQAQLGLPANAILDFRIRLYNVTN